MAPYSNNVERDLQRELERAGRSRSDSRQGRANSSTRRTDSTDSRTGSRQGRQDSQDRQDSQGRQDSQDRRDNQPTLGADITGYVAPDSRDNTPSPNRSAATTYARGATRSLILGHNNEIPDIQSLRRHHCTAFDLAQALSEMSNEIAYSQAGGSSQAHPWMLPFREVWGDIASHVEPARLESVPPSVLRVALAMAWHEFVRIRQLNATNGGQAGGSGLR